MIPCGSLALMPTSNPNQWSITLLPGNIVSDRPVRFVAGRVSLTL